MTKNSSLRYAVFFASIRIQTLPYAAVPMPSFPLLLIHHLALPAVRCCRFMLAVLLLVLLFGRFAVAMDEPARYFIEGQAEHMRVSLLSNGFDAQQPHRLQVLLRLQPEAGWHTYWQNPGDTGLPTRIVWQLPAGASAGAIQWPVPERIDFDGLINFGYHGDTLLPVELSFDRQLDAARSAAARIPIVATVKWLICKDVCIPGQIRLQLDVPAVTQVATPDRVAGDARDDVFERALDAIPLSVTNVDARYRVEGETLQVRIPIDGLPAMRRQPTLFFTKKGVVDNRQLPVFAVDDDALVYTAQKDRYLEQPPASLVLILADGERGDRRANAYSVSAQFDSALESQSLPVSPSSAEGTALNVDPTRLWLVLVFALLGGLILNAMPCVFPVLSLKVLSLVESGQHSNALRRQHGLAYAGGVVLSFLVVAGVLMLLRALGEQIGWGFQLQAPIFVAALVYVLFVLGLSLSGFIEVGSSLQNIGSSFGSSSGLRNKGLGGSFATGVLATVVATPCTAPFMGTAMGFALSQPVIVACLVFAVMGLGLALPFLLVAFLPALANKLPSPGLWMVRFKELLAFPLYLTAVWLLWVFARQVGVDAAALLLVGLVILVLALWLWRTVQFKDGARTAKLAALLFLIVALVLLPVAAKMPSSGNTQITEGPAGLVQSAIPYDSAVLDGALQEGKPVFVNMTADWCITCKVNEKIALGRDEVQSAFIRKGITYIKGDWTNSDPAITAYLEQFGRSGVPLYVYYAPGEAPHVLPQILTIDIVLGALQ